MNEDPAPLPAAIVRPWLEDNGRFIRDLKLIGERVAKHAPQLRQKLLSEGRIRTAATAERLPIAAVDASLQFVDLFDQVSILLQVVRVNDDGQTIVGDPQRVTGVNGTAMHLIAPALRTLGECRELAGSTSLTIADGAYFSILMQVNSAISRSEDCDHGQLDDVVKGLVDDGIFLKMLRNSNVIPMSKIGESDRLVPGISDRTILEFVLEPGEFLLPRKLSDATRGSFGIKQKRFTQADWQSIRQFYDAKLGMLFFRPHAWSRAFRIEGHLDRLSNEATLMPILAAIAHHTTTRTIVEPWPQFMADFTATRLGAVAELYGANNRHRMPLAIPTRTPR
jgi:hypothetical protein